MHLSSLRGNNESFLPSACGVPPLLSSAAPPASCSRPARRPPWEKRSYHWSLRLVYGRCVSAWIIGDVIVIVATTSVIISIFIVSMMMMDLGGLMCVIIAITIVLMMMMMYHHHHHDHHHDQPWSYVRQRQANEQLPVNGNTGTSLINKTTNLNQNKTSNLNKQKKSHKHKQNNQSKPKQNIQLKQIKS